MFFSGATRNDVFSDGNIKGSGCKPETDEMTDVDVKARFQTDTTGNSSNQILEISDSDIARGVFIVLFFQPFIVLSFSPSFFYSLIFIFFNFSILLTVHPGSRR